MEEPARRAMSACPLRISATVAAGHLVIELDGEVDIDSVPILQAGMDIVTSEEAHDVVIDLQRVSFLSPHGLSVLVKSADRMERRNRWVEFRGASPQIRRMLEWTGGPLRLAAE